MTRYLVEPKDRIFVKGYGLLPFSKNMSKSNLSGKYNQKIIDHAKESATDTFKTASKRAIQKTAGSTGDLIGNKIANKITKVSKTSPQNSSETVTNEAEYIEHNTEKPKETCIYPEKKRTLLMI